MSSAGSFSAQVGDAVVFRLKTKTGYIEQRLNHERATLHVHFLRPSTFGRPRELFLDDLQCKDIPERSIIRRLCFTWGPTNGEARTGYHASLVYAPSKDFCLREPTTEASCDACHRKAQLGSREQVVLLNDGILFGGQTYRKGDYVGIDPLRTGRPWILGQVRTLPRKLLDPTPSANSISVVLLGRYGDLQGQLGYISERRVYLTFEPATYPLDRLLAKVQLLNYEPDLGTLDGASIFFALDQLSRGCRKHVTNLVPFEMAIPTILFPPVSQHDWSSLPKPRMVDLFSGGGGALQAACRHFNPILACEMEDSPARTLKRNHPSTKVFRAKVEELLQRKDVLPRPGSIFLLTAGPPCQDHSGANRFAQDNSSKNSLLFDTLDLIDQLEPAVVFIENVPNMKRAKTGFSHGMAEGYTATSSFAVAAIRRLLRIGYQARLGVLNSRSYGSAQSRNRLFILGARRGLPLPSFPQPTHASDEVRATVFDAEGEDSARGFYFGQGTPGTAPNPAVTVRDAIGDLPGFEYAIPGIPSKCKTFPPLLSVRGEETRVGFVDAAPCAAAPQNNFQRRLRGNSVAVFDHYTDHQSEREIELILQAFQGEHQPGNARRVNPNGAFRTLLTDMSPGGRTSDVVHYDQKRLLTVAEMKRAMGLPDSYRLAGTVREKIKQLGNMIDAHVLHAIHSAILRDITPEVYDRWRGSLGVGSENEPVVVND